MRPGAHVPQDRWLWDGLMKQRALVATAEAAGEVQCGWKAGFGAPTARDRFGLAGPLIGALLDRTRLDPGATVAIGGWQNARAEAELAVLIGEDVPGDVTPARAMASVVALAPAIELVDIHPTPESPSEALSVNLFHRHWITGGFTDPPRSMDLSALTAEVSAMGTDLEPVHDVEALTGRAAEVLAEVARIGAQQGRGLLRGDVVILGASVPPAAVGPGGTFRFTLSGHDPVEVGFID